MWDLLGTACFSSTDIFDKEKPPGTPAWEFMNIRSNEGLVKSPASHFVTPKRIKIGTKGIPVVSIIRAKSLVIALMGSRVLKAHSGQRNLLLFDLEFISERYSTPFAPDYRHDMIACAMSALVGYLEADICPQNSSSYHIAQVMLVFLQSRKTNI